MKRTILLAITFCFFSWMVNGQNSSEWTTYLEGYFISDIADAGEYLWLCSYKIEQDEDSWRAIDKEIIQFEKATGNTIHYGFDVLGISPEYFIRSIKCDKDGLPWTCGDFQGILRMTEDNEWILIHPFVADGWIHKILIADNGVIWTTSDDILIRYNGDEVDTFRTNGLIMSLAEDKDGNIWMGTSNGFQLYYDGLVKFDGENQSIYNSSATGLKPMLLREIIFDEQGNKWMTGSLGFIWLFGGNKLVKYDDSEWHFYDLPVETGISSLTLQDENVFWLGTDYGLMRFTNLQWTVYDSENSGLPSNQIYSILIDDNGTKWIGTDKGLVSFAENELVTEVDPKPKMKPEFELFPNPANDFITLNVPVDYKNIAIEILNIQGEKIKTFSINKDYNRLDVSLLLKGVYLVRIQSCENDVVKKFVKQ